MSIGDKIVNTFLGSVIIYCIYCIFAIESNKKLTQHYTIELTYCDNRPKDTVEMDLDHIPTNKDVNIYRQAVPSFCSYLNVCNIKVIK